MARACRVQPTFRLLLTRIDAPNIRPAGRQIKDPGTLKKNSGDIADKAKGNRPLPEAPYGHRCRPIFFKKKSHRILAFLEKMINMKIARTFSLSTGKNGYREQAIRPHPEVGRVAHRTELHSHLLWP